MSSKYEIMLEKNQSYSLDPFPKNKELTSSQIEKVDKISTSKALAITSKEYEAKKRKFSSDFHYSNKIYLERRASTSAINRDVFHSTKKRKSLDSCISFTDNNAQISRSSPFKFQYASKVSPSNFMIENLLKHGICFSYLESLSAKNFFINPTKHDLESYRGEIINALKSQDMHSLRESHQQGWSLQCCNKNGESLIHMACRRGFIEIVKMFVLEYRVSLRVIDDYGRSPMHDACWTPTPNFELINFLLLQEPFLLYFKDKRGFSPLDYVRKEHWDFWISFLISKELFIKSTVHNFVLMVKDD